GRTHDRADAAGSGRAIPGSRRVLIRLKGRRAAAVALPMSNKGFVTPGFRNLLPGNNFHTKPLTQLELASTALSGLIPSKPGFGGHQQGQNRDNLGGILGLSLLAISMAGVIGMAATGDRDDERPTEYSPLPRYTQRRRPPKEDSGLAPDDILA